MDNESSDITMDNESSTISINNGEYHFNDNSILDLNNDDINNYSKDYYDIYYQENDPDKYCKPRIDKRIYSNKFLIFFILFIVTLMIYRILNSNTSLINKFIKLFVTNFLFVFVYIFYYLYKFLFPFFKTKYILNTKYNIEEYRVYKILEDIKSNDLDISDAINEISHLSKYNSSKIPNSYIIKYILNDGNVDINGYSLTFKEYFKFLFDKKFRVINFRMLRKPFFNINSVNNKYLLKNNNTTLWKNMLMNELDYYVTRRSKYFDYVNLNKRFRYYISNIFFYKWPLLFDFYRDNPTDYKFKHIQDQYEEISKTYLENHLNL